MKKCPAKQFPVQKGNPGLPYRSKNEKGTNRVVPGRWEGDPFWLSLEAYMRSIYGVFGIVILAT